jgi:hypothetical protein
MRLDAARKHRVDQGTVCDLRYAWSRDRRYTCSRTCGRHRSRWSRWRRHGRSRSDRCRYLLRWRGGALGGLRRGTAGVTITRTTHLQRDRDENAHRPCDRRPLPPACTRDYRFRSSRRAGCRSGGKPRRSWRRERFSHRAHEAIDVFIPRLVPQPRSVAPRKRADGLGQIGRRRHLRPFDEHRNHQQVRSRQSRSDFQSHEVVVLIDAPRPRRVVAEPLAAHDRQERRAARQSRLCSPHEVLTRLEGVHVAEDSTLPEPLLQRLVETARVAGRVIAPIADEDRSHSVQLSGCRRL